MDCECGSHAAYLDWWINFRAERRQEVFVRCPDCGKIGPSAQDEVMAIRLWEDDGAATDLHP